MIKVYINLHPDRDYSLAVVIGYDEKITELVRSKPYVQWFDKKKDTGISRRLRIRNYDSVSGYATCLDFIKSIYALDIPVFYRESIGDKFIKFNGKLEVTK